MERIALASPRSRARIIGVVYLLFFLTTIVGGIITPGTANGIVAHESTFRLGYALTLFSTALYVALAALFYQLFKHVSRTLSVVAVFFGLVGCAITAVGSVFQLGPLVVLGGSQHVSAFTVEQLQALAQTLLDLAAQSGYVALVFFGAFNLTIGILIFRSTFLPRVLGVLMMLSGLGWLMFLSPPLANHLLIYLEVLGILAEGVLMLWLLVMGVNGQRWSDVAAAAGTSSRGSLQARQEPA